MTQRGRKLSIHSAKRVLGLLVLRTILVGELEHLLSIPLVLFLLVQLLLGHGLLNVNPAVDDGVSLGPLCL